MKQMNREEINIQKTVLRAALHKGIIDENVFVESMNNLILIEDSILKEERLRAIKINKLKSKLNLYVTN